MTPGAPVYLHFGDRAPFAQVEHGHTLRHLYWFSLTQIPIINGSYLTCEYIPDHLSSKLVGEDRLYRVAGCHQYSQVGRVS
jgi:hypothetical protein